MKISQREKNEYEVLFYYLHCPDLRIFVREELIKRDIQKFSINHHHLIWNSINKIEEKLLGDNYLVKINYFTSINFLDFEITSFNLGKVMVRIPLL